MYYSGNADPSGWTDFNTNEVFGMSYEPLGFWGRLLDWVCLRLALFLESLQEEKKEDDRKVKASSDLL